MGGTIISVGLPGKLDSAYTFTLTLPLLLLKESNLNS